MQTLFSPQGHAALTSSLADQPLLAFDFDGTLAPIVTQPDDARIPLSVARRLERLSKLVPVAIITGRTVDDVRGRLDFEPHFIIGNHGAEDPHQPDDTPTTIFDGLRMHLMAHAQELAAANILVEDKQHSIALHYRLARHREQALALISRLLTGVEPSLRVYGGKLVVNVVSARAADKAQALVRLQIRCGAQRAIFLGDDINDEPVFARKEPAWLTIKVGREDPASQAMFFMDSPADMPILLDQILSLLYTQRPAT